MEKTYKFKGGDKEGTKDYAKEIERTTIRSEKDIIIIDSLQNERDNLAQQLLELDEEIARVISDLKLKE